MVQSTHNKIVSFIWGIADDVLRDLFKRGKYPDVILPMCVLRRLDAVLEPTKPAVLETKQLLDSAGITAQHAALCDAAKQAFYNTSKFTLRDLKSRASQQQLLADFEDYLNGFSANVQEIIENFKFRNHEEAGEHWTPRDAVKLMANLIFLPIADNIESGSYLLYDCACGTGGMLTVAEETLKSLASQRNKQVVTHLYGQEINPETFAICKAGMLLKGEGDNADHIVGGTETPPSRTTPSAFRNSTPCSPSARLGTEPRPQGSSHGPAAHRCGMKFLQFRARAKPRHRLKIDHPSLTLDRHDR
jgi:type I restriction enzyme M protein